ncbi:stage III sporulation protein AF [Frisingicoccus sp.]|uniref:stage III sporulation protein AF n=1 Tax=Frisingicoccus sp. TaxID=1918627 RepID=UPI003AB1AE79
MGIFREWIQNVVVFLLLMTMAGQLIPDEKYKKYIRLTMGLLLILVILLPVTRLMRLDTKVYQNFIKESFRISAADAKAGEEVVGVEGRFAEGYEQMIKEEIRLYFEANAMVVKSCELDMELDLESSDYGKIYSMEIGIRPKDRELNGGSQTEDDIEQVYIEEIKIGEADGVTAGDSELFVPEEKTDQWKKDLSLQFGIDMEQLKLEILS